MKPMEDHPISRGELLEALATTKREMLDAIDKLLDDRIKQTESTLREAVYDSQTEILKAFLPFQESMNLRLRTMETKLSNTDTGITERMAVLERRLAEIEKKLLLRPPAA
jgi:hypothetical protein